ncbi:MAG: sensor histidine kinase, partial [Bacteroidota bacterium]
SMNSAGAKYVSIGDYYNAEVKLLQAIKIWALAYKEYKTNYRVEILKQLAYVYNNLGNSFDYQSNYIYAAEYYIKALKIFNHIKIDTVGVDLDAIRSGEAITYYNLAFVMENNKNSEKSVYYSRQARNIFIGLINCENKKYRLTGVIGTVNASNSLGTYYLNKELYDSAFYYHNFAMELLDSINKITDNQFILEYAHTITSLGIVHKRKKEFAKALKLYLEGLEIREKSENPRLISVSLNNLSALFHEVGDYSKALEYSVKSWGNAVKAGTPVQKSIAAESIAAANEELGKIGEALKWHKIYNGLRDSIVNEENVRKTIELEAIYQNDKKELDLKLLRYQNELDNLKLKEQENRLNSVGLKLIILIVVIILIIVFSVLLYLYLQQRHNRLIKDRLLEEEKLRLKTVIETQEIERTRIARDLHDGIGQMLSAASMNLSFMGDKLNFSQTEDESNYAESMKIINACCTEVRTISHQMMPRSLKDEGLIIAIKELLARIFKNSKIEISFDTHNINERLSNEIENGVFRIIQELTGNIIKHSKADKVGVQLLKGEDNLVLIVEDNGVGLDENSTGNGIGLKNIYSRVAALNGSFFMENGQENGLISSLIIPLK